MRVQCADCEVIYDNESKAQCPRCQSHVYKILNETENENMASQALAKPTKPISGMTDAEFEAWQKLAEQELSGIGTEMADVSESDIPKDSETSGTPDRTDRPDKPLDFTDTSGKNGTTSAWDKWYPQGSNQAKIFCTHKPQEVINGKTWKVFAGAKYDCKRSLSRYPVLLNLSGTSVVAQHSIPIPSLSKWESVSSQEIMLDWNDGEDIDLPIQFWIDLRTYLAETKQNMLIFCLGGHGRTGTAIAAILISSGWKAKDAMAWIWKNYCQQAIETKVQEWYLENLEEEYIELLADSGILNQTSALQTVKAKKSEHKKGKK